MPAQPQAAQMTIFYGGQVIVLDDFPADKAKEIMLLAAMGSSSTTHTCAYPSPTARNAFVKNPTEQNSSLPSSPNMMTTFIADQAQTSQKHKPIASGMNFVQISLL